MDGISPISPINPIWPTWESTHPGFLTPGRHTNLPLPEEYKQQPKDSPDADEGEPFVPPQATPLLPAAPAKALRELLLDAGVRGVGPTGPGYPQSARELTGDLIHAYKHIANSLYDVISDDHRLPNEITQALRRDARGERELGLMTLLHEPLGQLLAGTVGPGVLNRWHQAGQRLRSVIDEAPHSIVGDLLLVEDAQHPLEH